MSAISPIEIADEKMVVGNRRQGRFTNRPRCPIGERILRPSTGGPSPVADWIAEGWTKARFCYCSWLRTPSGFQRAWAVIRS